jgi:hypothetical protein
VLGSSGGGNNGHIVFDEDDDVLLKRAEELVDWWWAEDDTVDKLLLYLERDGRTVNASVEIAATVIAVVAVRNTPTNLMGG